MRYLGDCYSLTCSTVLVLIIVRKSTLKLEIAILYSSLNRYYHLSFCTEIKKALVHSVGKYLKSNIILLCLSTFHLALDQAHLIYRTGHERCSLSRRITLHPRIAITITFNGLSIWIIKAERKLLYCRPAGDSGD